MLVEGVVPGGEELVLQAEERRYPVGVAGVEPPGELDEGV